MWQVGDVAVCVKSPYEDFGLLGIALGALFGPHPMVGKIYRVEHVSICTCGEVSLHVTRCSRAYHHDFYRKVQPSDPEFAESMRNLNPSEKVEV